MKIYKVTATGVITSTYFDEGEFKVNHPDESVWLSGKGEAFVGGYLREDQLAKLILNGLGGSRNREYLKIKRELSNTQQELLAKKDDITLEQTKNRQEVDELSNLVEATKQKADSLDKEVNDLAKDNRVYKSKVSDALEIISKVV